MGEEGLKTRKRSQKVDMREWIALKERKETLQIADAQFFSHDETTFFLVGKLSPLFEKK